jgi:uncharacterized protein YqeY
MSLKEQLSADLKTAMRAGDHDLRDTLRLLQAAIKQQEVDGQAVLDDAGVLAVLQKQAKQRRESISEYARAGRDDLVAVEQRDLTVIERYLPQQMSREEVEAAARAVIAELGAAEATGPAAKQALGAVMGRLMADLKGKADGRMVNEVARALLQG